MNASYAVIENGMVVNVIVWDGEDEFTVPDNLQLINISDISEQPGIGWAYSDGVFTAPLPPERSHDELVADAEQKKTVADRRSNGQYQRDSVKAAGRAQTDARGNYPT